MRERGDGWLDGWAEGDIMELGGNLRAESGRRIWITEGADTSYEVAFAEDGESFVTEDCECLSELVEAVKVQLWNWGRGDFKIIGEDILLKGLTEVLSG